MDAAQERAMTLTHPHDLPDVLTGAELASLVYDCDVVATAWQRVAPTDAEKADRRAYYEQITDVAKWHRVTGRDAGQRDDVAVHLGPHRVAYYRKARAQRDGEPDVMPLPAEGVRRGFSEGMQRALWGCVAC
jgi:hypothetical protein